MNRATGVATVLMLTAVALLVGAAGVVRASAGAPPPSYLALGDSLAEGVGATVPEETAYVPLFHSALATRLSPGSSEEAPGAQATGAYLKLLNLGVGGETAATLRSGGQLDSAVSVLQERNWNGSTADDVRVVTLSVGGNDATALLTVCGVDPGQPPSNECLQAVQQVLTAFGADFAAILTELRAAAGPSTRIIVMTYYNALRHPACEFSAFESLGDQVVAQLNAIISATAAAVPGIDVADVGVAGLTAADLQPDCRHPNDAGYRKIADAFEQAFGG